MATLEAVRMQEGDPAGQDAAVFPLSGGLKAQAIVTIDPDTEEPIQHATSQNIEELNAHISNLYALNETLRDLVNILSVFGAMRGADGALRVNALTGSTVAVSSLPTLATLTTLVNQAQMGGYSTSNMVQASMNLTAQQSNIVNMTG
jgi:hypothetical protein